ncbi:hypothetical protein [Paenarthrobacter nitroguajacolicus]|uniref:hypothetical protein n=1 Tax=Paenarthrobacter nitroguajacolicus TaxID=211146 RepID=UPI0015C0E8B9|nr:hypothetical protein [Paenarthrobacter nitroguajacolicus]NWL34442.1 hypothetical protein [Paenarthrobacter nitroguajacolicus]
MEAKVFIQLADGEPIEVGTIDFDLVVKAKQATRSNEIRVALDTPATMANAGEQVAKLGNALALSAN